MYQRKTLIEVTPTWMINGIFAHLQSHDVPWKSLNVDTDLDIEYYGNHSGNKLISPLLSKLLPTSDELTTTELAVIARILYTMFGENWARLWETLQLEYNPIENYSMTERMTNDQKTTQYGHTETRTDNLSHSKTGTETDTPNTTETRTDNLSHSKTGTETDTPNTTETRTDNLSHSKTGTETDTPNTTETQTPNITNTKNESKFGFNSSTAVPVASSTDTNTGTNTVTKTGTDQKSYNVTDADTGTQTVAKTGTEQKTYNVTDADTGTQTVAKTGTEQRTYNVTDADTGTQANVHSGTDTETRNYLLTRKGNIGVTTSQQMIESERRLWAWNFFRDIIFSDVDKILTIQIY